MTNLRQDLSRLLRRPLSVPVDSATTTSATRTLQPDPLARLADGSTNPKMRVY